jgi:hypothetical protein
MNRFVLAAVLLLPIVGWASDQDGYFRPYFMTNKDADYATCQGFVTATDLARQGHYSSLNQFNQWLDGFLTAYDMYTPDTFDIAFGKDLESLDAMLEKYCRQHPKTFFNKAAESLTFDLYTTRAKTAPKGR